MAPKAVQSIKRNSKATVDDMLGGVSERVLKQITEFYESGVGAGQPGAMGLKAIADVLGLQIRKPRKKISVMIIGNHSAGKSSFINWYVGEHVMKTGVAIETRGFSFVTSGRKRETLTGAATLHYFDYLEDFGKFKGIMHNLFTEVTTSKDKNFSCVDFVDTPGLVDGDMQYPFNVEDSIIWMADHADLILVFFDPIGQATCKRTLSVVQRLNDGPHLEKIHYYMSKADAVEQEHDRQRVLIQITQNLATRIRNSHAFNLPTFYLPRDSDDTPCNIPNAIQDVCKEVDKAINMTVQKNLGVLKADCGKILVAADQKLLLDRQNRRKNWSRWLWRGFFHLVALFTLLVGAVLGLMHFCPTTPPELCNNVYLSKIVVDVGSEMLPLVAQIFGGVFVAIEFLLFVASFIWRPRPVLTKLQTKQIQDFKPYVKKIAEQEEVLYQEYIRSIAPEDYQ